MHRSKGKLSGVLHKGFKPDKCKTALRMALARIKLLRNRKEVQVRQMRREVAQLLDANQDQTARIRVEHVIREEKFMQAYDLIEVYCELIVARLSIIGSQKTCPIDLKEAIASVIFASMRCSDVTELVDVRKHFMSKYGKEFVAAALEVRPDSGVNRLVIEKLSGGAPDTQMKIKTLTSIAEEHNIKWEPKEFEETLQKQNEDLLHGTTYSGGNIPNSVMPTSHTSVPSYSYVESPNSRVPTAHSYSSAEVPDNSISYVAANPNAYSRENRGGSEYSVPPSSQHGALAYSSAQIPGPNSFSDENTGGPNVCRPYSQYGTTVPDTTSRSEELPWERKSSASGSNWNVDFRDATSAAQAAAESAEMASFAARAAAQLASRGNFSAEQNTEPFESAAYTHETTPRKQQAEHLMKDGQRSFSEQSSGANDPMFISSNARKDREREETNCVGSVNMSGPLSSAQFHSYSPDIHEYGMPTEPDRAHSPEHPYSDDSSEKESNSGRPEDHAFNLPCERLFDARLDGRNIEDTESKHASFDLENTDNYHRNYTSSHGTFTHGSSTVWDNQNDKTGADSAVVFDQYDSVVGEKNLLDCFSSKHTEEPAIQDHMGFSNADWSQQHRSTSPVNHSTYTLFSRTETHPSYNLEVNRKDIPSHSYDNVAPTFDSDGVSSDEEVTTVMHAKPLRSHSRGSDFCESKEEIISGKVVRDINESIEDYNNSPGSNTFYKEQYSDSSPRSDYSRAYRNLGRIKSRDYDLSEEEEMVPHKLDGAASTASSGIAKPNEREPFSLGRQTSATSTDYDGGDICLNFGRLTPGLRNKLRQPPPYTKDSGDNMLPKQLVHKTPAIIEKPVHSEENNNLCENTRNTSTSTTPRSSLGADYNRELYDQHQSVEARVETRSTMRSYFELGDVRGKLSEQFSDAPSSMTNKSSVGVNSSQELYHEKPGVGSRRETRTQTVKSYLDSDSEDELGQREKGDTKWSTEQAQSRRTREVTADTKRATRVQIGAHHGGETESMPKEAKSPTGSFSKFTEQKREAPGYSRSRVPAPRTSPKPARLDPPSRREKPQEADLNTVSVTGKEDDTESSAETPKESTPKTAPAHVHPKLPTDYDTFAAHFMSLRTNRR